MSNTRTVVARPYFSLAAEEQIAADEAERNGQNPNDTDETGSAGTDTSDSTQSATPGSKEDEAYKERYVNLKRYHDTSIHEARKQVKDLELKLQASASSITPPTNAEELEKFKENNPELYNTLKSQFSTPSAVSVDSFNDMQAELIQARQDMALEQIKMSHPDMVNIVADPLFTEWVEAQTSSIQNMIRDNSSDANAFIRALDLYKLDKGITSSVKGTSFEKSDPDASAADAVTITGASADVGEVEGRIWTREEIRKLSPREFEMFELDLEQAMREGRVR